MEVATKNQLIGYNEFLIGIENIPEKSRTAEEKLVYKYFTENSELFKDHTFCRVTLEKSIKSGLFHTQMKLFTSRYFSHSKRYLKEFWNTFKCALTSKVQCANYEIWAGKRVNDMNSLVKLVLWKQKEKKKKRIKIEIYIAGKNAIKIASALRSILA